MSERAAVDVSEFQPASTLLEAWAIFDPTLTVTADSPFYVPREDHQLRKLSFDLIQASGPCHAFLCGHRGSGKTTELSRLRSDPGILERYLPVYLTAQRFGTETVHLSHDALLLEMGLELFEVGQKYGMPKEFEKDLEEWGREVIRTSSQLQAIEGEAGLKGGAWLAQFRALLQTRRQWEVKKQQVLEPKVQDLIGVLDRMAIDLKSRSGKDALVIVDDLEKGDSEAHRKMQELIFRDHYEVLVQPQFAIVYTLPVYFRALPGNRIPNDQLYAFPAARLYDQKQKVDDRPLLAKDQPGYRLMRSFVERRVESVEALFEEDALDELLLIGGGLFRETARVIREAAFAANSRDSQRIENQDAERVFHDVKKQYQPMIRGDAVKVLKGVLETEQGWVPKVEDYLQSRAVVEYENHDLWLDVRYPLKRYVRGLAETS